MHSSLLAIVGDSYHQEKTQHKIISPVERQGRLPKMGPSLPVSYRASYLFSFYPYKRWQSKSETQCKHTINKQNINLTDHNYGIFRWLCHQTAYSKLPLFSTHNIPVNKYSMAHLIIMRSSWDVMVIAAFLLQNIQAVPELQTQ